MNNNQIEMASEQQHRVDYADVDNDSQKNINSNISPKDDHDHHREHDKVNGTPTSNDQDGGEFSDIEMEKSSEGKDNSNLNSIEVDKPHVDVVSSNGNNNNNNNNNNYTGIESHPAGAAVHGNNGHGHNQYIPSIKAQVQFLPKPEPPPPQPKVERSKSLSMAERLPSIGKYIRERSSIFSAAIIQRLSSLREENFIVKNNSLNFEVTEFKIPGVRVIVKLKSEDEAEIRGRISFFSRSNCRDCTAVRKFFREKGLMYVEINTDVFPNRAKELVDRTGSSEVPKIFFNEKLLGCLVTLNSMRNSGEFEKRMEELLGESCPMEAPAIPVFGIDDEEEEEDELAPVVRILRQKLPIADRYIKMTMVKNCFAGDDLVEIIIHHLDCGRKKGFETAKKLAHKHFFHHVFGENEFEKGNHFYRLLEQEPFIIGCFNVRHTINDNEPKSAPFLADRLSRLMFAILEAYVSDDRRRVNYHMICHSEEFRRYLNVARDLQRINLKILTPDERLAFFLNLYNAMVIHAVNSIGHPEGILDQRAFFLDFQYVVGGYPYSLNSIQNGILRINRKSLYSLMRPFSNADRRLELAPSKVNPLIHFGLCNGTRSSPTVRFFTAQGVEGELRCATREYFQTGGIEIDLDRRTVYLTRIFKWFSVDFGQEKDVLKWVMSFLDATKAGLLTHLLSDGGPIHIVYQNYDGSGNF